MFLVGAPILVYSLRRHGRFMKHNLADCLICDQEVILASFFLAQPLAFLIRPVIEHTDHDQPPGDEGNSKAVTSP